jgi:hypothetical protein
LTALAADLSRGAAHAFVHQAITDLSDGVRSNQAQLTGTFAAVSQTVAASAVRGAGTELGTMLPACDGADRAACISRHIREFSRAASMGATEGVGRKGVFWKIGFGFGAGFLLAALGAWALLTYQRRRASRRGPPQRDLHPLPV